MSSANLADVRVNGVSVPEAALNAAIAGHFNVPVAMISGDDAIVKEAQGLLGPIEGAVVKWAYGFHSARTLTPEAACDVIREKARKALGRIREMKPYRVKTPVSLDVRFKNYRPAEVAAYLPIVERTDPLRGVLVELRAGTLAVEKDGRPSIQPDGVFSPKRKS
jgi:D-amino peptidase